MSRNFTFLFLATTVIIGCTPSHDNYPASAKIIPETLTGENKGCYPESDLLHGSNGIFGGQRVQEYDLDSKRVIMLYYRRGDVWGGICTASAIAPDVLLTAAHCVMSWKDETVAVIRTSISCESGFSVQQHTIKVRESIQHENYDSGVFTNKDSENDVGLIFLEKPLPPDFPIYRIANPAQNMNQVDLIFYGYGAEGQRLGGSGMLHKVKIPSSDYKIDLEKGKVIVDQTKGKGLCHGDSGGPGLISVNGELQILGVNSYVHPNSDSNEKQEDMCRGKSFLAIPHNYLEWIKQQMELRQYYLHEKTAHKAPKGYSEYVAAELQLDFLIDHYSSSN